MKVEKTSIDTGRMALELILTQTRDEEHELIKKFKNSGIIAVAVDFGGEFVKTIPKILESAVVASKRKGVIVDNYVEEGAILGATRSALEQIKIKGLGWNVGGKVGIVRNGENVCVAIYMQIGIINLDEMAVALSHRAIKQCY